MIPAGCALRSMLALKLTAIDRTSHVMPQVTDEGLALFAGLYVGIAFMTIAFGLSQNP